MIVISVGDIIRFKDLFYINYHKMSDYRLAKISRKHLNVHELSKQAISSYFIDKCDEVINDVIITKINNTLVSDALNKQKYCEIQFLTCHTFNEYSFLIGNEYAICVGSHLDQENSFQRAQVHEIFDKKITMHLKNEINT